MKRAMKTYLMMATIATAAISFNTYANRLDMTPGLWEHTMKMNAVGASPAEKEQNEKIQQAMVEMKRQMESMPPEKRKMIEQALESRGIKLNDNGLEVPTKNMQVAKDGIKMKVCLTQEEIDKGDMHSQDDTCEEKYTQNSSKVVKISFECKGARPMHGESEVIFQDSKSYAGKTTIVTTRDGKDETIQAEQSGKWLSNDCGSVKPKALKN